MLKETDLFEPVKNWFLENGYEVYAEVTAPMLIGRPDVVARKRPVTICVELKKSISFELLYQALERKRYFNYVYIGIPKRKSIIPYLAQDILRREGIGVFEIDIEHGTAYPSTKPRFNRPSLFDRVDWDKALRKEYKQHVGGYNGPGLYTPYKITILKVKEYLQHAYFSDKRIGEDGWRTMDEILEYCETHYCNPKPSLSKVLLEIEHEWCESKKENRKLHFRFKGYL
jgi:hypothetical protein